MSDKNIYQRINAVKNEVSYIKKDANIQGGGANYKAVTRDSVVGLLREHIVNAGIVVETSQVSGGWTVLRDINAQPQPVKMGLYSGIYEVRFVNIDDPKDRAVIQVEAHASDNGDKAPGKAMTYAEKTALIKQFQLETGLNDEERVGESAITDDMATKFGYFIETSDAMGLFEFMAQFGPDDPARKALFDSVPYGQKGKFKEEFLSLSSQAHATFDEWASYLEEGIESEDPSAPVEYWDELTQLQKQNVWPRLQEDAKEFLKKRKGE